MNVLKVKENFWCIEEFVETWGTSRRKKVINIVFRVGCMKCYNKICFVSLCKKVVCSVQIVSVCIIALSLALMSAATVHRGWKKTMIRYFIWMDLCYLDCNTYNRKEKGMVFCYQNCSDVRREKKILFSGRENFWKKIEIT